MKTLRLFIFSSLFLIIYMLFLTRYANASSMPGSPVYGDSPDYSVYGYQSCPDLSSCGTFLTCWNSQAVGVTDCGSSQGCTSGSQLWSKYDYTACVTTTSDYGIFCFPYFSFGENVCSTADKCQLEVSYLRAGFCNCTTGGIYKTCCNSDGTVSGNACVQVSNDGIDPPWEGVCPAGATTIMCGMPGYPDCGAAACASLAPPTPTSAATPTPTPAGTACPGGTTNCANSTPTNYTSCTGTPNYLNNSSYDTWCLNNAGGANNYCYSCTPSGSPAPTPTSGAGGCVNGSTRTICTTSC